MSVDTIGNFLTIIRNGVMASKPSVVVFHSKLRESIAQILKDEGFIRDVVVVNDESAKKQLKIFLKYSKGESVIHRIDRVSTPGRRVYASFDAIKPVIGGLGVSILSTNQGVMSQREAKKRNVGGEVMCTVW